MKNLKYSFVIPALNEEKYLGPCIKSILAQKATTSFEIIVSDNGSKDKTVQIAKNLGCRIVEEKKKGIGPARNKGAQAAKGEYICFIDADGKLSPHWLEEIEKSLKNKNVDAILGMNIFQHKKILKKILYNTYTLFAYFSLYLFKTLFNKPFLPGNNIAIKKSVFFKIGGFEPVVGEDVWLSRKFWQAKGTATFNPKAVISYSSRGFDKAGFLNTITFWIMATVIKKNSADYNYENKNWKK